MLFKQTTLPGLHLAGTASPPPSPSPARGGGLRWRPTRAHFRSRLASLALLAICTPSILHAGLAPVEVQFRGCDAAGWCRFALSALEPPFRVRADGVVRTQAGDAVSVAVRNRLNALLSSMIHQHKHIVLHDLRALSDGTFAAMVIVNEANVASDPILLELREKSGGTIR